MICVDLEKAYDKVNREMYKEMYWKKDGIRGAWRIKGSKIDVYGL